MISAPGILASAAIDSDRADTVLGLRTTMYWFGIFSVVAVVAACIPTRLDCIDELFGNDDDDDGCCSCCLFIPISDSIIVPNGSEADGDDDSDGVASRKGALFSLSIDKAIAFGISNNNEPE
jgi:hypothetical protein